MTGVDILVIEDNAPLRRAVATTLRSAGYRPIDAADGRGALAAAREHPPALVITDLMLPDMEPEVLLEQLHVLAAPRPLPVIVVSGSGEKLDTVGRGRGLVSEQLLKPVEPSLLLAAVARHLDSSAEPAPVGRGRTVVIADDDPVQLKLLKLQLERLGFTVIAAADGREALSAVWRVRPAALISDVLMPGFDGFELCRAVRADPDLAGVTVVLVSSAYIEAPDRALALRVGASACLERRPELGEVVDALLVSLDGARADRSESTRGSCCDAQFMSEHLERMRAQLDRQVRANRELRAQLSRSATDLSVVSGISAVVSRMMGTPTMLTEALARCTEVAELTAAVVRLGANGQGPSEIAAIGDDSELKLLRGGLQTSVRHSDANGATHIELPRTGGGVALALPLGPPDAPLGQLAIAWRDHELTDSRLALARTIAGQLGEAVALHQMIDERDCAVEQTIARLSLAAESRDRETAAHTDRVGGYSAMLAQLARLDSTRVELIRVASVMHDVGKIGVPDAVLLKPGPLTEQEFAVMKTHTTIGYRILAGTGVQLLDLAAEIALTHHERIDGTGYPFGLKGEAIPIEGRIAAITDVFDALTSERVYRRAWPLPRVLEALVEGRGTQFDAELLDLFVPAVERGQLPARREHPVHC